MHCTIRNDLFSNAPSLSPPLNKTTSLGWVERERESTGAKGEYSRVVSLSTSCSPRVRLRVKGGIYFDKKKRELKVLI